MWRSQTGARSGSARPPIRLSFESRLPPLWRRFLRHLQIRLPFRDGQIGKETPARSTKAVQGQHFPLDKRSVVTNQPSNECFNSVDMHFNLWTYLGPHRVNDEINPVSARHFCHGNEVAIT